MAEYFQKLWNTQVAAPVTDLHTTCLLNVVNCIISCQVGYPRLVIFHNFEKKCLSLLGEKKYRKTLIFCLV